MAGRAPTRLRARLALGVARKAHCENGWAPDSTLRFSKRVIAYRALLVLLLINFYSSFFSNTFGFPVLATNTTSSRDRALLVLVVFRG